MLATCVVESIQEYTLQVSLQVVLLLKNPVELVSPELLCEGRGGGLADPFSINSMVPVCGLNTELQEVSILVSRYRTFLEENQDIFK